MIKYGADKRFTAECQLFLGDNAIALCVCLVSHQITFTAKRVAV